MQIMFTCGQVLQHLHAGKKTLPLLPLYSLKIVLGYMYTLYVMCAGLHVNIYFILPVW